MGTRLIKRWRLRVGGVDIEAQMIALAQEREDAEPMGIEYRVVDTATLGSIDPSTAAQTRTSCTYREP
jgi:hypothetical protein